jgi:protein SMG6
MRRTAEPESISDATSSSYVPHRSPANATVQQRQLFDHCKDVPASFSVLHPLMVDGLPLHRSYPMITSRHRLPRLIHSMVQAFSGLTLSSGTANNFSASSALFDRKPSEEPGNNAFAIPFQS